MSAVVHLEPTEEPQGVRLEVLERLTAAAFGQRRKMLRQSLKGVTGALATLDGIGIDPTRRAETVPVVDWVRLARALS
jgi:16S rRNA (adenine1518-N6/adenine1519-N6)-dimethyltransferase